MRGYFGIGVEQISKEQNVGTLARSAHAFGASFFFAIAPSVAARKLATLDQLSDGRLAVHIIAGGSDAALWAARRNECFY